MYAATLIVAFIWATFASTTNLAAEETPPPQTKINQPLPKLQIKPQNLQTITTT
jgi:hypothetical protein